MKNKILMLHGWNASSQTGWFPAAKEKLEKMGYQVFVPDFPGNYYPKKEEWVNVIKNYIKDENWIVITHSLGGVALLRFLEEVHVPISRAILTATPFDEMKFEPINSFFENELNWDIIKKNLGKIDFIYGDEDQIVPLDHGKKYAHKLNAPLYVIPECQHLFTIDLDLLAKLIKENNG